MSLVSTFLSDQKEVQKSDLYRLLDLLPGNTDLKEELRSKIEQSTSNLTRMLLERRITKELELQKEKIESETKRIIKGLNKKREQLVNKMREKLKTKKIQSVSKPEGFVFGFDATVFGKFENGALKLLTMADLDVCQEKGYRYDPKYTLIHIDWNPEKYIEDQKSKS